MPKVEENKFTIKIESILGGHAPTTHFAAEDQFRASLGIDPSMPIDNEDVSASVIASGLIRPVGVLASTDLLTAAPLWIVQSPKATTNTASYFVLDAIGSLHVTTGSSGVTNLADGGTLSTGTGNGCTYYDNFLYIAKDTDIARYGPLNGAIGPEFNGTYWTGTLSKTALVNTTYPSDLYVNEPYPNHFLHRHSDGRLYIADVVGNRGTIHYIQTASTTYEGDTDAGSTYNKVQVGYGLWPMAMESYGSELVIAFNEAPYITPPPDMNPRSKIAFWDTLSTNVNKITWREFPDSLVTAIKNVGGVLYFFSSSLNARGFRITRYVGGLNFEEVAYWETGRTPFPGAVDAVGNSLVFGGHTLIPEEAACVYSLGLHKPGLTNGLFNIARDPINQTTATVTSLIAGGRSGWLNQQGLIFGTYKDAASGRINDTNQKAISTTGPPVWWSKTYRIGQPFKITKIRIPVPKNNNTGDKEVVPKIYVDGGANSFVLTRLNYTDFSPETYYCFTLRPTNVTGQSEFWLELRWPTAGIMTVGLPITIEYELTDS